jgi:hypothetical protein
LDSARGWRGSRAREVSEVGERGVVQWGGIVDRGVGHGDPVARSGVAAVAGTGGRDRVGGGARLARA